MTRGTEGPPSLGMRVFGVDPRTMGWFGRHVSYGPHSPSQSRVRSAIILMTCASTVVAAAMVLLILAMTDRHWVVCTSKKSSPPSVVPSVTVYLGLLGGIFEMEQSFFGKVKTPFSFQDTDKYCHDDQCHRLYVAGCLCTTILSLALVSAFCSIVLGTAVQLQLLQVWTEEGPFGTYVSTARCLRQCVSACVASVTSFWLAIAAMVVEALVLHGAGGGGDDGAPSWDVPSFGLKKPVLTLGWVWFLYGGGLACLAAGGAIFGSVAFQTKLPSTQYFSIR